MRIRWQSCGLKDKYEIHHGVKIRDSALVAAATLSNSISLTAFAG